MSNIYKESGVDIEAGYQSVKLIKNHLDKTNIKGVMGAIGTFGSMFDLSSYNFKEPVLVSGTDGVGTKLKLAIDLDIHDTIGIDAVAMCVNDIICHGAQPLFFLDYLASSKNEPEKIAKIVKGVADACLLANCSLVGGETAEMPGFYADKDYDIAGFAVGVVEKSKIITKDKTKKNQVIIGLKSSGIHSNGFSLVRKIINDNNISLTSYSNELKGIVGEILLRPTKIYVREIMSLMEVVDIKGIAHITGGGFYENIPRTLNKGLGARINLSSYQVPEVFHYLQNLANISDHEMYNVFNMGVGMIVIVDEADVEKTLAVLDDAFVLGKVIDKEGIYFEE